MNRWFSALGCARFERYAVIGQHFERADLHAKITFGAIGMDHAEANFSEFHRIERAYAHTGSAKIAFIVVNLNHTYGLSVSKLFLMRL